MKIAGHYNSRHVRKLILRVHDTVGLPWRGYLFEHGVWESRLIKEVTSDQHELGWGDTDRGLRGLGIDLDERHTNVAHGKPIEGSFHHIQDRMRLEPGFVGKNERVEKMERMQDFIARARAGKEDPRNEIYTMEQWVERLDAIFCEYNNEIQNGYHLPGVSPAEMWQESLSHRPLRKLHEDERYILATHRTIATVTLAGIVIRIGGLPIPYCGDHTSELINQKAIVYYNIDFPEVITLTDMKRTKFYSARMNRLPSMSATPEQFAEYGHRRREHVKEAREIFGNIKHHFVSTVTRDTNSDDATKALGEFNRARIEAVKAQQAHESRIISRVRNEALAEGIAIDPSGIRNPERVLEGIRLMREARREMVQQESATTEL